MGTFFAELADTFVRNLGLTEVQLYPLHISCSNCLYGLVLNARTALEVHTQFRVALVINCKLAKTWKGSREPCTMSKRTSNLSTCLTLWDESSFRFAKLNCSRFGNVCLAANWGSMMFKSNATTLVRKMKTANSFTVQQQKQALPQSRNLIFGIIFASGDSLPLRQRHIIFVPVFQLRGCQASPLLKDW